MTSYDHDSWHLLWPFLEVTRNLISEGDDFGVAFRLRGMSTSIQMPCRKNARQIQLSSELSWWRKWVCQASTDAVGWCAFDKSAEILVSFKVRKVAKAQQKRIFYPPCLLTSTL